MTSSLLTERSCRGNILGLCLKAIRVKLAHLHTKASLFKHTAVFMSVRHSSRFPPTIAAPSAAEGAGRAALVASPRPPARAPPTVLPQQAAAGAGLAPWRAGRVTEPFFPKPFLRQQLFQNGHRRHELGQRGEAAAFLSSRGGMFHVSTAEPRRSPAPRGRGRRRGGAMWRRSGEARASRIPHPATTAR